MPRVRAVAPVLEAVVRRGIEEYISPLSGAVLCDAFFPAAPNVSLMTAPGEVPSPPGATFSVAPRRRISADCLPGLDCGGEWAAGARDSLVSTLMQNQKN